MREGDAVETALAFALEGATKAGEWATVAQLLVSSRPVGSLARGS